MRKSGLSSPPSQEGELVFEAPLICQRRQIAFAIEREIRGEIADDRRRVAGEHLERVRLVPQERRREEERIASGREHPVSARVVDRVRGDQRARPGGHPAIAYRSPDVVVSEGGERIVDGTLVAGLVESN